MKTVIVASTTRGSGKTSVIVGLAEALGNSIGYVKPFGDRLLYKKKRLWDYDSAIVTNIFNLKENPEDMSIGFEHAKLRYMYDKATTEKKLKEAVLHLGRDKEILFVECGDTLACGASVHLDAVAVTKTLNGQLIVVVSGADDNVLDDIAYIKEYVDLSGVDFGGVIINKVRDVSDFETTSLDYIKGLGVKVLGILPYRDELAHFTVGFLAGVLFAKVLSGESGLKNSVKRVFVGAMSAGSALTVPHFKEPGNLVISSGDRDDMLIAALETQPAGIILAGNILPPTSIISKAEEAGVPLLLASPDTYQIAKRIDELEPLMTKDAPEKVLLLEEMMKSLASSPHWGEAG